MVAHDQGAPLNAARLAGGLAISGNTVRFYLDVLTDLFMIRQLRPWSGHSRKRLVKVPRIYVRDAGLVHSLLRIQTVEGLLGHPVCGTSWEGFVTEHIVQIFGDAWRPSYYRSAGGAELDLLWEGPGREVIAIEVKRTLRPSIEKGFKQACEDVGATRRYYVIPKGEPYPLDEQTEAIGLTEFLKVWQETHHRTA